MLNRICARVFALTFCAVAAGCSSPYIGATAKYAETVAATATTLQSASDLATEICIEKAWVAYLQAKLRFAPNGEVPWSKWLASEQVQGSRLSWSGYCAEVRTSAAAMGDAFGVLEQYAAALGALAEEASYDGADVASLANSAGGLAGETDTGKAVKGLAEPLQKLSSVLVGDYTQREIHAFAAQADPHVTKILAGASRFVDVLAMDLDELDRLSGQSLDQLEPSAFPSEANYFKACRPAAFNHDECTLDPGKVRAFIEWSRELTLEMSRRRSAIAGLKSAIGSLQHTQQKFMATDPSSPSMKEVLGGVAETLTQITKVRDALSPKKGS